MANHNYPIDYTEDELSKINEALSKKHRGKSLNSVVNSSLNKLCYKMNFKDEMGEVIVPVKSNRKVKKIRVAPDLHKQVSCYANYLGMDISGMIKRFIIYPMLDSTD